MDGYSAYKLYKDEYIYHVINNQKNYRSYVFSFFVGGVLFLLLCEIVTSTYLYNHYVSLYKKSTLGLTWSGQHFRFKSLIWATGTVLMLVNLFIAYSDTYKFSVTPLRTRSEYGYVYYILMAAAFGVVIVNTIVSIIIIIKRKDSLIEIPKLFLTLTKKSKCIQRCTIFLIQYLFIMTVLISALCTFHATGIFVAILVDPVTVLARLSLSIIIIVFSLFMCTYVYEMCEREGKNNYCKAILYLFVWITFTAIIILIGRTYILATIFSDNTGVFHSFGQIFPAILLAITGWLVKREYDNFSFVKELSNDQTNIQTYN